MQEFELAAQRRTELGKGANRRLRRANLVPAVVYGANKDPVSLTLSHQELQKHLQQEAFYSHILTLKIDEQPERVVLKALQRHPYRPSILHVDFQRVSETQILYKTIPLHFINEDKCIGVKQGGGVISHHLAEVEIRCLPKDLPEFIAVDLGEINLNQVIHLSNLALPVGVEIVALLAGAEHDLPVVSVHLPRGTHTEEEQPGIPGTVA
jgi:large subunit ribosomal protein L25